MASASNGILGPLVGRVGTVTGYIRNGVPVIRIATRKKDNIQSQARLAQREKLKLCIAFTSAFTGTDFFRKTFPAYGHKGTGLHRATSALMNLAVRGTYPDLSLSYPDVLVAKGILPGAVNASAYTDSDKQIVFSWDDNSGWGTATRYDQAVMVAYDVEYKQAIFTVHGGARNTCNASLDATPLRGRTIAAWLSFLNEKGDAADSTFCGMVAV